MTTKTNLAMAAALLLLCACTVKKKNSIKNVDWLIGTWEQKTLKGSIYETWSANGKNELKAKSYMLKQKDTIVFETVRLVEEKGVLLYIPTVKNQNGGSPIRYEGKKISQTQLIFENKTHDFPQIISYAKISNDSLIAEISGMKNKKEERRHFPMKRLR